MLTRSFPASVMGLPSIPSWPAHSGAGMISEVPGPSAPGIPATFPAVPRFWQDPVAFGPTITILGPGNTQARRRDATAGQIVGYGDLQEDWDGDGAAAPSADALSDALDMLDATPDWLEAPKPMVLASGDVALYWDRGETYAEIGFDGTGTFYAFATSPSLAAVHLDDVTMLDEARRVRFPPEVIAILGS